LCPPIHPERRGQEDFDGGLSVPHVSKFPPVAISFLLWRSQEDGNLNVATDTIVVVVFLVDNRLLVAENSISFSFDKMAYVDTTTVRDTFQSLDIERQREKWERKAKKASEGNGDTKRRSASTSSWLYWLSSERDLPECHKVNGIRTRLHPLAYP
jgi:hypothetical protein